MKSYVLLRHNGNCIGTAKYFTAGSAMTARSLHGLPLQNFARQGEDLVVVYHVQIFREHVKVAHPYSYGGSESPPSILGDMNDLQKQFKAFIAWDNNELLPQDWGCELQDQPQSVSETVLLTAEGMDFSSGSSGTVNQLLVLDGTSDKSSVVVEEAKEIDPVTKTKNGETSFRGKRFTRLRRQALSSAFGTSNPRVDKDVCMERFDVSGKKAKRAAPIDRMCRDNGTPDGFLTDDEIEVPTGERQTADGTAAGVRKRAFDADMSLREYEGSEDIRDNSHVSSPAEVGSAGLEGNSALVETSGSMNDAPEKCAEPSEIDREEDSAEEDSAEEDSAEEGSAEEDRADSIDDLPVEPGDCDKVLRLPQKRAYLYHSRKRGVPAGPRDLRKRRKVLSKRVDNPFLRDSLRCCKKLECFENRRFRLLGMP